MSSEVSPALPSAEDLAWLETTTLDRWIRRLIMAGFGAAFSFPYFHLLNRVRIQGSHVLDRLPKKGVVFLSNHQTYFLEAIAFYDLLYIRQLLPWEDPFLRFCAAEETMKKNLVTSLMTKVGAVTIRRSFRDAGKEVSRPVDLEGASRIEQAIAAGWMLHYPAGTTKQGAPLRPGVPLLLHRTRAVAVPVRVDGFRELLAYKQLPGKLFRSCSITLHPPLDLADFYSRPYSKEDGQAILGRLDELIGDRGPMPAEAAEK